MADRRPPGFNVDLDFYDSEEVLSIPRRIRAAAIGIWTLAGSYSARKLTDGHVSAEKLKDLGCTDAIRDALMATKPEPLWVAGAHVGAIQFTRWTKWQRTYAEVKAYRDADAERKRKARESLRDTSTSNNDEMSARTTDGQAQNVRADSGNPRGRARARQSETKSESVSTAPVTSVEGGPGGDPAPAVADKPAPDAREKRGTRIPDNWRPSKPTIAAMREQFPHLDLRAIHTEFCDYWRAVPGAKGRKLDWDATWRNRVREIAARQPARNGHSPPAGAVSAGEAKVAGWAQLGQPNHHDHQQQQQRAIEQ